MALKQRKRGTKPIKLKDAISLYPIDRSQYEGLYLRYSDFEGSEQRPGCWPQMTEIEQELAHILSASASIHYYSSTLQMAYILTNLYNNFGERYLLSKFYEYIDKWDGTNEDMHSISDNMQDELFRCIKINRYKWTKLYESTIAEFNPLYNVDAYEETTRTLEQDGTITGRKTGSDTNAHAGTVADAKSGKDTLKKTGTDTLEYEGSETTEYVGDEKMIYEGSEDIEYTGTEVNAQAGTETHTKGGTNTSTTSRTTTESSNWYDSEKTVDQPTETDTLSFDHRTDEKQFQNRKDTTSYTDRQDVKSFDDRADTKTFDDRADARTLNLEDEQSYNSSTTRTFNNSDTLTHNTTDTETRDLLDTERILHRRYGNIGITMSTQLLESFRTFVNYHLIDIIAHDIADYLTQGVY